jgi:hypothetical protein
MRIDNIVTGNFSSIPTASFSPTASFCTSSPSRIQGTWTVTPGDNTETITMPEQGVYRAWAYGSVPNGIALWTATFNFSNTNVPVLGSQYAWYYADGNALQWTSLPNQFTGTNGVIISSPDSYAPNTANVLSFGIRNNSATTYGVSYGYIKLTEQI